MKNPDSILVTGASSGLGEALARAYAAAGIRLCLLGRNAQRLEAVAEACRQQGANTEILTIDVRDRAAMAEALTRLDEERPFDLVIANAGISGGTGSQPSESPLQAEEIFGININGVVHTVHPLLDRMAARRRGQIALVSSLAGFRGLPGAPAYSASKCFVRAWGEALRPLMKRQGVGVTVICPGFIETPLTAVNSFPMPLLMPAPRAANIIKARLQKNPARIAFPWPMALVARLLSIVPLALSDALVSRAPAKAAGANTKPEHPAG